MIGILVLVVGLVLLLATPLYTLGIVLTVIGGVLVAVYAGILIAVFVYALSTGKKVRWKL